MPNEVNTPPGAPAVDTSDAAPVRLLVTLPALNEGKTIASVIAKIPREIPGVDAVEVLVVDDGSSDDTGERARGAGARVIRHSRNRGVGAAFHSALAFGLDAGFDLITTIDADGQFDPADIPTLIRPVLDGEADFATASRFLDPSLVPDMPAIKLWGNRMMSRLVSNLAGERFHDVSCGMRCYHRRAALQLYLLARFTYTQEVFLNLAFRGLRITEVPIRVRGVRQHGKSRVADNLWNYAFRTAIIIFRSYRDYHPLRFFGALALLCLGAAATFGGTIEGKCQDYMASYTLPAGTYRLTLRDEFSDGWDGDEHLTFTAADGTPWDYAEYEYVPGEWVQNDADGTILSGAGWFELDEGGLAHRTLTTGAAYDVTIECRSTHQYAHEISS
ncbi:MAG: glycosyltransferase family 2 protein [Acidobacteriota bacterium]